MTAPHGDFIPLSSPSVFDPVRFRAVANKLGVLPRRLSYAQKLGLVHGLDDEEIDYLTKYWPLLDQMERCLGNDPRVKFAAISAITVYQDDLDGCAVVVQLEDESTEALAKIERDLTEACGDWNISVWPLSSHKDSTSLAELLDTNRVLVDQDDTWTHLQTNSEAIFSQAESEESEAITDGMQALKELAGEE